MKIKVTNLDKPIYCNCPRCGFPLVRMAPIEAREGIAECGICGAPFKWEEAEEDNGQGQSI